MTAPPNEVCKITEENKELELRETGDTVNTTSDDSQCGNHTWVIHGFPDLGTEALHSEKFKAGGFDWSLLLFPRGNKGQGHEVSVFLELSQEDINMPFGWSVFVHCFFGVCSHKERKLAIQQEFRHRFSASCTDWGFVSFASRKVIVDSANDFLLDDALTVVARVQICTDYSNYDSKKETGFVGLKNQGATCYLNSALQTFYHIPYFRKAVYRMPTENISTRIPIALQNLFYNMQSSNDSVSTKELTESFGWTTYESYQQHDVQEFNTILRNKLEETAKEPLQKLYEGHETNYIDCIDVNYKSTSKESFYDLQLDVKGCKDVYASFDKYVQDEKLDGDNQYKAENLGFQDARKGTHFADFPPVLQLHLKRFEYDYTKNIMTKINDRYEFPLQLDLDKDNGRYLSSDADRSVKNLYSLYSVLVHSGGVNAGHYYAFIRPLLSEQWYKFNDECVTKEDLKTVLEEQYGGEAEILQKNPCINETIKFLRHSNAYMLVYVRNSDKDMIMCNIKDEDIADHIKMNGRRWREEEEIHFFTTIKVVCDAHLRTQIGKDVHFDLVDFHKVQSFRFQTNVPLFQIQDRLAVEFGIPTDCQKIWMWSKRKNNTWRPSIELTPQDKFQTIEDLKHYVGGSELRLFLEEQKCQEEQILSPPSATLKEDILLFFKLYDPEKKELRYIGKQHIKQNSRPMDDLDKFKEMAGFEIDEEVELYEERSFIPKVQCIRINNMKTYKENELQDGDIICLQRNEIEDGMVVDGMVDLGSIQKYFHHVKYRQHVHFRKLEMPDKDAAFLELNTMISYDELVKFLAPYLKLDNDDLCKIRFTPHDVFTQRPGEQPIMYLSMKSLREMLLYHNQMSDILYYEILDMPLRELEEQKVIKVSFYNSNVQEVSAHTIMLHCESTVDDVIRHLRGKVEMSDQWAEMRILQISGHKIWKILSPNDKIKYMVSQHATFESQNVTYRAEEIPEEERSKGPDDCVIYVYHFRRGSFQNDNIENFGEPFLFLTRSDETLAQLKERVKKKLEVPEDQFSEYKFASVHLNCPTYLNDDAVVLNSFERKAISGPWEFYLGLEHSNYGLELLHPNQAYDKAMEIYNWT